MFQLHTPDEQRKIKVLFVDDDPHALTRLDAILKAEEGARNWDVRYASNGHAALAELEFHGSVDVVVTDLHMPMMDGTTLLTAVRTQYPSTVRIIASDFTDLSDALRSIPVAHQFLASPIDPTALTIAIERTVEIQQRIVLAPMRAALGSVDVLPSPPQSVVELNRALARPEASVDEVAAVISQDPAMTAKLLQLVNSAFFGLSHRITNISQATSYLGLATVRNLLLAVELVNAFVPESPELIRSAEAIHTHSLAVADMARTLMHDRHQVHDAFAAGMMHDVGLLAMMSKYPERYLELQNTVSTGVPLDECEVSILGANHADIGAYLLGIWGLPHSLVEAVARSHDADAMSDRRMAPAHAVFIAEQVLNGRGSMGHSWESARIPDNDYLVEVGAADTVNRLMGQIQA